MQALLAALRFPFDARRLAVAASANRASAPVQRVQQDVGASDPVAVPGPASHVTAAASTPGPSPCVEVRTETGATVSEPVAPGRLRLSDPRGVRVVPFRPTTRWPLHRACARIYDPFRAFPDRGTHLAVWLEERQDRR